MERKLIEITVVNEYGYIGYKFDDSKAFASGKVKKDKTGRTFFVSKGEKYYLDEIAVPVDAQKGWRNESWSAENTAKKGD